MTTRWLRTLWCLAPFVAVAAETQGPGRMVDSTEQWVRGHGPAVREGFVQVRRATERFRSLDAAVQAGYPREVAQCLHHAAQGGMGFHHMNRALLDRTLDVTQPEILLYERRSDGRYELNGVEFIVPYSVWPADSTPPKVMGLSLKPSAELSLWYLHMWTWKENPAGLFADWNPRVQCPSR